jgi:molybdate/tungstate transport system ATP-binding protein
LIQLQQVTVQAGGFSLCGISFEIPIGQYGVLMGRTGSGKTTLLEAICGLRRAKAGKILLCERDVTHLKPSERGVGYVPQDKALFQTMSVYDHLAFALMIRKYPKTTIQQEVNSLAKLLGIDQLLPRKPYGLSGGEAQRVALGRALSAHPRILCLDEPLSALDDELRLEMYELLEKVRAQTGVTILHVTHQLSEAQRLADVILLLKDGRIEKVG